jgi:hypothetical protein
VSHTTIRIDEVEIAVASIRQIVWTLVEADLVSPEGLPIRRRLATHADVALADDQSLSLVGMDAERLNIALDRAGRLDVPLAGERLRAQYEEAVGRSPAPEPAKATPGDPVPSDDDPDAATVRRYSDYLDRGGRETFVRWRDALAAAPQPPPREPDPEALVVEVHHDPPPQGQEAAPEGRRVDAAYLVHRPPRSP